MDAHYEWRTAIRLAAAIVTSGAALVGTVYELCPAAASAVTRQPNAAAPAPEAAIPIVPPLIDIPAAVAEQKTADGQYLTTLRQNGGPAWVDRAEAISTGHGVCQWMQDRHATRAAAAWSLHFATGGRQWSLADATVLVNAAVSAYCPELN